MGFLRSGTGRQQRREGGPLSGGGEKKVGERKKKKKSFFLVGKVKSKGKKEDCPNPVVPAGRIKTRGHQEGRTKGSNDQTLKQRTMYRDLNREETKPSNRMVHLGLAKRIPLLGPDRRRGGETHGRGERPCSSGFRITEEITRKSLSAH